eukprot:2170833-Heterocapsa_arctica.AAC.1
MRARRPGPRTARGAHGASRRTCGKRPRGRSAPARHTGAGARGGAIAAAPIAGAVAQRRCGSSSRCGGGAAG